LPLSLSIHILLVFDYPFLHKQPDNGLLGDYLGHEEFFEGNELLGVKGGCYGKPSMIFEGKIERIIFSS
jgi:hypothetical protein